MLVGHGNDHEELKASIGLHWDHIQFGGGSGGILVGFNFGEDPDVSSGLPEVDTSNVTLEIYELKERRAYHREVTVVVSDLGWGN